MRKHKWGKYFVYKSSSPTNHHIQPKVWDIIFPLSGMLINHQHQAHVQKMFSNIIRWSSLIHPKSLCTLWEVKYIGEGYVSWATLKALLTFHLSWHFTTPKWLLVYPKRLFTFPQLNKMKSQNVSHVVCHVVNDFWIL